MLATRIEKVRKPSEFIVTADARMGTDNGLDFTVWTTFGYPVGRTRLDDFSIATVTSANPLLLWKHGGKPRATNLDGSGGSLPKDYMDMWESTAGTSVTDVATGTGTITQKGNRFFHPFPPAHWE